MHSNTLNYIVLHTELHSNTLKNALKHTWTILNTLWITIELLNSGEYAGPVTVFFSFIYTFLEQQFVQLNSYFLHFEFQIIKRSGSISNSNFLGDDNTCHMSFQIINKLLLSSSFKIELLITVFNSI